MLYHLCLCLSNGFDTCFYYSWRLARYPGQLGPCLYNTPAVVKLTHRTKAGLALTSMMDIRLRLATDERIARLAWLEQ